MAVENAEHVKQFLVLAEKSTEGLKAICEGLQLDLSGSREDLLNRLVQLGRPAQIDFLQPQTIPLRTRNEDGTLIPEAERAIKYWRYQIFNAKNNYREFKVMNSRGELYSATMRYILCPQTILEKILSSKWYDPRYMLHNEFLSLLEREPQKFNLHLVQRSNKNGSSYIMLHAELKAA